MAQSPADRSRAQRRAARDVAAHRPTAAHNLSRISRRALVNADNKFMYGDPGSDPKRAGSLASKAMHNRINPGSHPEANPEWEQLGEEFFYHDKPV